MKIACVAVVKNEERHIAEWVAFQFAIGFDTVVLYDNKSTDGTTAQALNFAGYHDIRIFDWHVFTPDYQTRAYEHAAERLKKEFDWLAFFDTDEFLVLKEGLNLKSVLQAFSGAAAVTIPWAVFGSSGHKQKPEGLVIESYTHRSGPDFGDNKHVKSIVRPQRILSCLNPHGFKVEGLYLDLAGREPAWQSPGILARDPDYTLGKLHHYFTRSHADWLEKLARGYHDTKREADDFKHFDRNEIVDKSALRYAPAVKQLIQQALPKAAPKPPPPVKKIMPAIYSEATKYRFSVVACARWETPYIVEWLTYHRWLGFEHVYLYCNDDDPAELYDAVLPFVVGPTPFVTFHHHPDQGDQATMYRHYLKNYKSQTEWLIFLDIDEFLTLKKAPDIKTFMARFIGQADLVFFNWLCFGANGFDEPPPGSVLLNYTRREDVFHPLTKYIVRSAALPARIEHGSFWHDCGPAINATLRMTNPIGTVMTGYHSRQNFDDIAPYLSNPATGETLLDTAYIAHFPFKARSSFLRRKERGLKGDFGRQFIWADMANGPNFENYLKHISRVEDHTLRKIWQDVLDGAYDHSTMPRQNPVAIGQNIARGKAATQSSLSEWSRGASLEKDAQGAVDGKPDGTRKFHTAREENPWWQVDLGLKARLNEIRIFNTQHPSSISFKTFRISVSPDGRDWTEIDRKTSDDPVGGADGKPYIWRRKKRPVAGRFVRVTMLGEGSLHLDQVEVYGTPFNQPEVTLPAPAVSTTQNFSSIPNPLDGQGFIVGWEGAALGNRLSCFANMFALGERTGIPIAFPQILTAKALLDLSADDYVHPLPKMSPENLKKMGEMAALANKLFGGGYEKYSSTYQTVDLANLAELKQASGIVVFAAIRQQLTEMKNFEAALKAFCGRGNGVIMGAAFWRQYMDMRVVAPHAEALRRKIRIGHKDGAGKRAQAMQEAGDKCVRIGVHMRRTDYATWYQGKYFFSVEQYVKLMRSISKSLGDKRHYFCVCSDEKLDAAVFANLPVWYEKGSQEDDFVALSKCHYVVGPRSTFGTWSAFLGRGKRLVLTPERITNIPIWAQPLNDAVEIIYPTGSYLPGDPTAKPI
jgi:hypothetical protein